MMSLWTQFARTGDPSVPNLVNWPIYDPDSDPYLEITDRLEVKSGFSRLVG
jgi:para-nitrobenzyl esterase